MLIEEKVYALLSADAGVSALTSRIKPPGDWQNLRRPYVVHFPVAPEVIPLHDAADQKAALTVWRSYQVSCFGDSYSAARTLATAIVAALSGQHGGVTFQWTGQTSMFESDVRVFHVALDFEVWEALSADTEVQAGGGIDGVTDWDTVPSVDAIPS